MSTTGIGRFTLLNRDRLLLLITRTWAPLVILLGAGITEVSGGWATGTFIGLAVIVASVAIAVPVSGPVVTLISASMGALYFAYLVPQPVTTAGMLFMRVVPGFFALAPIAAVLRAVMETTRATAAEVTIAPAPPPAPEQPFQQLLSDVGAITDASSSYQASIEQIARLAIPLLADWVVMYEPGDDGVPRRTRIAAHGGAAEAALEQALHTLPRQLGGHDPLGAVADVLRTGELRLLSDVAVQGFSVAGRDSSERLLLDGMEADAMIMAPLRARARSIGALVFARARGGNGYQPEHVAAILEYCRRAALALESSMRFEDAAAAQQQAESTRDELLTIVDNLSSGFIALDEEGHVTHMNRAAEAIAGRGRSDLLGRNLWQVLPPNTREGPLARFVADVVRRGTNAATELSVNWTGQARWVEVQVAPSHEGTSLYMRDVTDRRAMAERLRVQEDALRESQKMEAVGRLSGRLAHDFNNLLMSIAGCAELLRKKVGDDGALLEDIREILRSTERASSLTRQLMTYSRKQVHQPRLIDLGSVVTEMQRRLLNVLREDIILVVNVDAAETPVNVDPNQIEHMLLNFAMNSRDAMVDGGTLRITVSNATLESRTTGPHARLEPGRYVCLDVSDTGCGIEPAALPHVFEPFFTTKPANKGTGLGLASVHGIVRQNHGSISVNSTVGRGTTFQVLFPAASEPDAAGLPGGEDMIAPLRAAHEAEVGQPASGVILVAEDEQTVRRFVCEVLRQRGYTVLEARTGIEGLAVARRQGGTIDLLLTDVVMPEMGGRDLAARIRELDPQTRILFMSGYAENEIAHHGVLTSGAQLLEKPFTSATLLQRVRAVMADPPAAVRFTTPAA